MTNTNAHPVTIVPCASLHGIALAPGLLGITPTPSGETKSLELRENHEVENLASETWKIWRAWAFAGEFRTESIRIAIESEDWTLDAE